MSHTTTVTRSTTAASAGDSGAGVATFERDSETGVITFGGQNRQLWVLVYEGSEKSDVPTCGAIYTSGEDGGEIICLRKCTSKAFGVEAITKHDKKKDVVHACSKHRGNPEVLSKLKFCIPSIWKLTEVQGLWDVRSPVEHNILEFLMTLQPARHRHNKWW